MAWYDIFRRNRSSADSRERLKTAAGVLEETTTQTHNTYDDNNITFTGELSTYDYEAILRDKQRNIVSLFELADYYVDSDPIVRGIVKGVYAAFSMTDWVLVGTDERIKKKYEDYYRRINLRDRMASIFYQYFKYGNVYIYLQEDGNIITLPVHMTRISNMMLNGEPLLEYNTDAILTSFGEDGLKKYIDDGTLDERLKGYPVEIRDVIKRGEGGWVQLNPDNTFVLQDLKEDWMRYAIPLIAAMLAALKTKAKIAKYEDATLGLAINSFVHVKYGNDKSNDLNLMPNVTELSAVRNIFRQAMGALKTKRGVPLAVTNNYAKAEVIQPDMQGIFDADKYKYSNAEILAAGGISGIIVSGRAEDGSTFASAQVSINTADKRIELARKNFCELMDKINRRVNGDKITRSNADRIPKFTFIPVDLSGNAKFQKACEDLWKQGCLSTKTMLDAFNLDYEQEVTRKKMELADGTYQLMNNNYTPEETKDTETTTTQNAPTEEVKIGRPEIPEDERTSDLGKAYTGKQPKPSNPEGSLGD